MVDREEETLELHAENPGKISVEPSVNIDDSDDLELVYTPGVAEPCREISENKSKAYDYTSKGNMVAVVSDGSAVLGLGDIGPEAAMPVMEGKSNLMKKFGNVDGFPICLESETAGDIVEHVQSLEPTFGAINLEDIKAPRCFRVERTLKNSMDIPVFHDDQHGTAIVVSAALQNALDVADKQLQDVRIAISGAGASGIAVAEFLLELGAENIVPVDSFGIIRVDDSNKFKADLAENTLASHESGGLDDAIEDADVFIGLSAPGIVSEEMVESMSDDPIVFALANPEPEILPDKAKEAGAYITATGRSDFDNQVNNSLAFPGIFRGALDADVSDISEEMKAAASEAIRDFVEPERDRIVPETLDQSLALEIADRVREAAEK
ncbi:NAD-dependent malic enzyme [Nanohaloarchaea archaeon]|nr:NAD-dependent malic enzyme [Candidatus Nanohaloarchaea archaeon]